MSKQSTVVGIGEALWDMLPEGKQMGGAPANFAYHASQFGCDSYVVSAVGDDDPGREIIAKYHDKRLKHVIATVPYPTGTVEVELDTKGVLQHKGERGLGQHPLYSRTGSLGPADTSCLLRFVGPTKRRVT